MYYSFNVSNAAPRIGGHAESQLTRGMPKRVYRDTAGAVTNMGVLPIRFPLRPWS